MFVPPDDCYRHPITWLEVVVGLILIFSALAVYYRPEVLKAIPTSVERVLSLVIFFFVVILVYSLPRYGGVNK